jgi:hypothetical protein
MHVKFDPERIAMIAIGTKLIKELLLTIKANVIKNVIRPIFFSKIR